ncbi:MAG TPA: YfhO family protein [Thermoanaerobaculia bacterium]|nr:YfhO family protein [Thermoanaerobaculia bacterium]
MTGGVERPRPAATAGAALAFLALSAAAFWPVLSGARTFFHLDLYYEHLPVWQATQRALLSGQSPFWIDGEYCGHPTLFHQEAPLFYPPTAPLLLTGAPVHRLADLFTLFHFALAGFAAFLLVRELTGSVGAGLFAGVAWMLSARMVQSAIWPNAVAVAALVPLFLWGCARLASGKRRSGVLWAAVAGGLALDAARPHVLLAAAPLAVALVAVLLARAPDRARTARDLALAAALALALGAPSLLPSALLLPETARARGLGASAADYQPLAHGRELDMVFLPVDGPGRWPETAAYAGALPLLLFLAGAAALALGKRPARRAELGACFFGAAAGLALAFGDAGPYRFVSKLPLVRGFRVPERFLLSWSLAIAVGAALVLAWWLEAAKPPRWAAAAVLLVLGADLIAHARSAAPTATPDVYRAVPDVVAPLAARLGPDAAGFPRRFLSLAIAFDASALPDGDRARLLREAGSLKGALALRFGLETSGGAGPPLERIEQTVLSSAPRALALGGVAAVVLSRLGPDGRPEPLAPPTLAPAEGLDRAFLVGESVVVPEEAAVSVASSPALDPRRTAVLEEGEPLRRDPAWDGGAASVSLVSRSPSRVVVETRAPAAGYLLLLDAWEAGWSAAVDGAEAPVLRADAAFRAVRVPAGTHRVAFVYAPRGLREGLGLGLAGLLGLLLAARRLPAAGARAPRTI